MKKKNLIIFDLGNVVVKFDHNISASKFARRFGLDKNKLYDLFFDSEITRLHDIGRLTPADFYKKVKEALNIKIGFKEFKGYWNNIFYTNPGVSGLISKLKARHKIYLMSNTNKLHFDFIKKKFPVIKKFDKIILSYEFGSLKPDPEIYKYAMKLAGTKPETTLYIDDRKELIEGAKALGINAIVFKNLPELKQELKSRGKI